MRKTLLITILIALTTFFMYSCGDENEDADFNLKTNDVAGTWYSENGKLTENSCDLKGLSKDLDKKYYFKVDAVSDTNVELFACKDSTCSKADSAGVYSFKKTIKINKDDNIFDFTGKGYDCKIIMKSNEYSFTFNSSSSASEYNDISFSKSGTECTKLKAKLEEAAPKETDTEKKENIEDTIKMLGDNGCKIKMEADLKKQ